MTYGHLRADCLYTGISSGPNARYRVWESLYLFYLVAHWSHGSVLQKYYHLCDCCCCSCERWPVSSLHQLHVPSVLWHCWLGVRKSIRPVKKLNDEVLAWLFVWSEVRMICIQSSWCLCHRIISCFIKIQIGLTFLLPAYPGCPQKETIKLMSVCLSLTMLVLLLLVLVL